MGDIVSAIEDLFIVRKDAFPKQREGVNEYSVVKDGLTKEDIVSHLKGKQTVGSWQIDPETNKVKWICFDFDGDLKEELSKAKRLYQKLKRMDYNPLLEFSGRRGYHIWLFVEPVDAEIARKFALDVSKGMEVSEVFPKQDKLDKNGFGGQVKLLLGLHRASNKWSYLFDDDLKPLTQAKSRKLLIKISGVKKDLVKTKDLALFLGKK